MIQRDSRLALGSITAIMQYGTIMSSSRTYLAPSLMDEAEAAMETVFGGKHSVVLASNVHIAHQSVLPTLVWPRVDAMIFDQQVGLNVKDRVGVGVMFSVRGKSQ